MKPKQKKQRKYVSLFTKSLIAFVVIGIIPLLAMGFSIYSAYSDSILKTLLTNLSQMTLYVGKNVSDTFSEMEENTKYIYNYGAGGYDYFYELMQDDGISETKRNAMVTDVLRSIVYLSPHIDHVMFVTPDGRQYTSMRPPEIMLNSNALTDWHQKYLQEGKKKITIIPTHTTDYFFYSKAFDYSIARNIMNTRTIKTAESEPLGTLYIDVNMAYLTDIIQEVNFGANHEIMIVDKEEGVFAYHTMDYNIGRDVEDLKPWLSQMAAGKPYIKTDENYLIYSLVPDSNWVVVDKVSIEDIERNYKSIRNNTIALLCVGAILLGIIYLFYSRKTNKPIRELKEAMGKMQEGKLDTRVAIESNDEVGVVADGLNRMAENLQNHIGKVYIAEIKQRNAELEALKTQIQPHYLYNTLDVIRMTAITNDDNLTADMLTSLSAQLKYLIGTTRDMVPLRAEIDNIRNYFNLIRIRFDNRFELEIDIPADLLSMEVPQLILQPIVENAVNHGLRPKQGSGRIGIYAKKLKEGLEITVMDDGIGMSEERLKQIQELLESHQPGKRTSDTWESIGVKNVYDRIKLIYGKQYGLEISSYEGMGTMVKYQLPMVSGGEEHV